MKFEIQGGDPVQQARRAAMFDPYEKPEYWLSLAERAFIHGMRRTGNTPDVELSNVVDHLVKAAEFGADPNGGFLSEQLAKRIEAEPEPLASVWRAVAVALELMAQQRIAAEHEHARIEAIDSMTPAAQAA